jgi:acyl carrier protein
VNNIHDFLALVHDEIGLPLTVHDATLAFDQVPGWDSMHLLSLLVALERTTGRRVAMADVLAAANLGEIYALVTESVVGPRPQAAR